MHLQHWFFSIGPYVTQSTKLISMQNLKRDALSAFVSFIFVFSNWITGRSVWIGFGSNTALIEAVAYKAATRAYSSFEYIRGLRMCWLKGVGNSSSLLITKSEKELRGTGISARRTNDRDFIYPRTIPTMKTLVVLSLI